MTPVKFSGWKFRPNGLLVGQCFAVQDAMLRYVNVSIAAKSSAKLKTQKVSAGKRRLRRMLADGGQNAALSEGI